MNVRKRLLLVVTVVALLLGASLPVLAQDAVVEEPRPEAANPRPAVTRFRGVVVAIAAPNLTIRTPEASVEFLTGERTRYYIPGQESATLADLQIGDLVEVGAVRKAQGGLLAALIRIELERVRLDGDVTQISGNNVKIQNPRGEILVHTGDKTRFRVPGIEKPTLADIHVGDHIHGQAYRRGQGSTFGLLLAVVDEYKQRGQVTAIAGAAITIKTPDGTLTLQTDDHTRLRVPGVENPTLADIHVGDLVGFLAFGQPDSTILARGIQVLKGIRFQGDVTAKSGATITVSTARGSIDLLTNAETRYRVAGIDIPTLDDVHVGDHVAVSAVTRGEGGGLLAKGIGVLPDKTPDTNLPEEF